MCIRDRFKPIKKERLLRYLRYDHCFAGLHYSARHTFAHSVTDLATAFFRKAVCNFDSNLVAIRCQKCYGASIQPKVFLQYVHYIRKSLFPVSASGKNLADLVKGLQLAHVVSWLRRRILQIGLTIGHNP